MTAIDAIHQKEADKIQRSYWVPACNQTEEPFTIKGYRLLYCWNPIEQRHAYIDLTRDVELSEEEMLNIFVR